MVATVVAIFLGGAVRAQTDSLAKTAPVEACDRLSAYAYDERAVSRPVARQDIDLLAAEVACGDAAARYPDEPRFQYQLSRILGYLGRHEEADVARRRAAAAGYPIAMFVMGYRAVEAGDRCEGGALIRKAADAGSLAASASFIDRALADEWSGCAVAPAPAELERLIAVTSAHMRGSYEKLLVRAWIRELAERSN